MKKIMVCVTRQKTCRRLIDFGRILMNEEGDSLHIVHVAKVDDYFLGKKEEADALDYLYKVAVDEGAYLTVLKSNKVKEAIAKEAELHEITDIVVGATGPEYIEGKFILDLREKLGEGAKLIVVPA